MFEMLCEIDAAYTKTLLTKQMAKIKISPKLSQRHVLSKLLVLQEMTRGESGLQRLKN